jgi:hypothetical protein
VLFPNEEFRFSFVPLEFEKLPPINLLKASAYFPSILGPEY